MALSFCVCHRIGALGFPTLHDKRGVEPDHERDREADCNGCFGGGYIAGACRLLTVAVVLAVPEDTHHSDKDVGGRRILMLAFHGQFPVALVLDL